MAITEEGADLLMTARQIRVSELRYYFNFGGTVFFHSKLFRGSAREVDHAIVCIGSAIIDSDLDLLAVLQVGYLGLGAHRQTRMGGGHCILIKGFAIGGLATLKARSVPRCGIDLFVSLAAAGMLLPFPARPLRAAPR